MRKTFLLSIVLVFTAITASAQQDTTLQQYAGKYKFADGGPVTEITFIIENGSLVANSAAGSAALVKEGEDVFSIPSFSGKAKFTRGEDKKVKGVTIEAMGLVLEGTKQSDGIFYWRVQRK